MNIKRKIKHLKFTRKRKLLLVSYLVIFMFICTSFHSIKVNSDDYSTYLYQYDITVDYDYANLQEATASYENEYRNYFYSGTEFPYDTSVGEWIGLSGTSRYNYVVTQAYLDNLDDERAFKQQETLIDDYSYSISDYNISDGSYNEFETNHSVKLLPNLDILKNWDTSNSEPENDINLHYTLIDEYITDDTNSLIRGDNTFDSVIDTYEVENKNITHEVYSIRVNVNALRTDVDISNDLKVSFNYSGNWEIDKIVPVGTSGMTWNHIDFFINPNQTQLDNIQFKIIAPSYIPYGNIFVSSVYFEVFCNGSTLLENLEYDDTEYSNINSYANPINATYTFDSYSETESNFGYYYGYPDNPNDEIIGTSGTDINWIDYASLPDNTTATIISEVDNHKNVIELHNAGIGNPSISHFFPNGAEIVGIREFWFGSSNMGFRQNIYFRNNLGKAGIRITLRYDKIQHHPNEAATDTGVSTIDNKLYHIKVSYDCSSYEYELWINGVQIGGIFEFYQDIDEMTNVLILSNTADTYNTYLDGWGNPAESEYNENDNTNPYGLQTELENDFQVDYEHGIEFFINNTNSYYGNSLVYRDLSNINDALIINTFDNTQESGIIEFITKINSTSDNFRFFIRAGGLNEICILFSATGYITAYNNSVNTNLITFNANTDYHFKIKFDVILELFDVYINNNLIANDFGFRTDTGNNISNILFQSWTTYDNFEVVIDNLDYSWSNGYYENRIVDNNTIDVILETNVLDITDCYQIDYKLIYNLNITSNIEVYIYDFVLDSWLLINNDTISIEKTLTYVNTTLTNLLSPTNTSLFRFRLSKMYNNNIHFKLSLDYLEVKLYLSVQLYNAFHWVHITYYCYNSGGTLRGRVSMSMEVHKEYIEYDTSFTTYTGSGWLSSSSLGVYTLNDTAIDIETMELQFHVRYGSGLDGILKMNLLFSAIINYNLSVVSSELKEVELTGSYWTDVSQFQFTELSYHKRAFDNSWEGFYNDSDNNKRAFSCFRGVRVMRSNTVRAYNRFFEIPYFSDDISVGIGYDGVSGSGSGSEPSYPSGTYWEYETFRLAEGNIIPIVVENWTVDYNTVYAESYEAKYFYDEESISRSDLGSSKDWTVKLGDIKISFVFIRNGLASIINTLFFFFQYLFYLVVASLSYILMYLGINILVLIWNVLVYYIFIALIWILWYLYSALYYLFLMLYALAIYVYEVILIPFMYWLWEVALPWIIDFVIVILAHIITIVIWCITLGEADYDTIYENVYRMLRIIVDEIIAMLYTFVVNLDYVLLFILYYILLTGMLYVRYLYVKARGFNNRAEQLYSAFEVFVIPIMFTLYLFKTTKDLVNPYTS